MSDEDQTRAQEGLTGSAGNASTALDDLTAAARRADQTFSTGLVNNLPRTIADVAGAIPGVGGALAELTRIAEARAQTLRQFTDIGLNFNYNIETMSQAAINARMSLEELAVFAGQSSEELARLGTNVDSGLTRFTRQLNDLLVGQSKDIERNLSRLGYETDEIIQTFLSYEQQMMFAGVTSRRSERERNLAAQEYAKTLDELATLTGRQRDELDAQMREVAGRGEIMLAARDLPENMRGELADMVGQFTAQQGNDLGILLQDMLTTGIPLDQRGVDLLLAVPEMGDTMMEMRRALRDPTTTPQELDRLQRILNAQAADLMNSELAGTLGVFRDLDTPFAGVAEQQREAAALQLQAIRRGTAGGTAEEAAEAQRQSYEARLESALTDTRTVYNTFIDSQIELERARNQVRQQEFDLVYGNLQTQIVRFGDAIVGAAQTVNERITTDLEAVTSWINNQVGALGSGFTAEINRSILAAAGVETERAAVLEAQLSGAADRLAEASEADRPAIEAEIEGIIQEIENEVRRARLTDLDSADFTITDADITILNRTPITEEDPQSIGTLGTAGRLFRNFGTESLVPLHNIEAVLTPRQMGEVVQNSAGGLARAILGNINSIQTDRTVDAIMSSGIVGQDQLAVMQGNLNTIMRSVRESIAAGENTTIDTSELESEIRQIAVRMRAPLEEALTSALRPHLEQLVTYSKTTADSNERIQRNTRVMTGTV